MSSQTVLAEKMEFISEVAPSGTQCFLESIAETIQGKLWQINYQFWPFVLLYLLAVVQVETVDGSRNLVLTITNPKGKKLETLSNQEEMKYHFAAYYGGNHQICIQNMNSKRSEKFNFKIETGVQATDYSNIVTKKHLRPVELQAQKIADTVTQLRQEFTSLILSEENLKSEN